MNQEGLSKFKMVRVGSKGKIRSNKVQKGPKDQRRNFGYIMGLVNLFLIANLNASAHSQCKKVHKRIH